MQSGLIFVAAKRVYETSFPSAETPISESSNWINGLATGLDWQNVNTTTNKAMGDATTPSGYSDPTALVTGAWADNQGAEATVFFNGSNSDVREFEIRLHSSLSAHSATGYECLVNDAAGGDIVKWNGTVGDFVSVLSSVPNAIPTLAHGDIIKAEVIGTTIKVYVNGVNVMIGDGSTYTSGKPGIGFFSRGGSMSTFGFSHFKAYEI